MSPFTRPACVYWEDTDGAAIICHANNPHFLERARSESPRAHGHSRGTLARDPNVRSFRPKRLSDFLISALRAEAEI